MKTIQCRELGFDCDGVVRAESDDDLLRQVAKHARDVHGLEATPELVAQVRNLLREE